jgi:phosphinothricin acetyltransferase
MSSVMVDDIRPSVDADVEAIAAIHAHHVLHGTGSFETEPPSMDGMRSRRAAAEALGDDYCRR